MNINEEASKRWDKESDHLQNVFDLGENPYNRMVIDFFINQLGLRQGFRILDIGCGVGKYGFLLSELGCDVTLIDISEKMVEKAKENLSASSGRWTVRRVDWDSIEEKDPLMEDGFDIVMSTMSPAIHDESTVEKAIKVCRGYVFLTHFIRWDIDDVKRDIFASSGIRYEDPSEGMKSQAEHVEDILAEKGISFDTFIKEYAWEDELTVEKYVKKTLMRHFHGDLSDEDKARFFHTAASYADEDGLIKDSVRTDVKWICFKA